MDQGSCKSIFLNYYCYLEPSDDEYGDEHDDGYYDKQYYEADDAYEEDVEGDEEGELFLIN